MSLTPDLLDWDEDGDDNGADETVCGETIDHDGLIVYEDEDQMQFVCRWCGAEWWEDR